EGLFAQAIVLVEGPTEALSLPIYLAKAGLEVAKEGVAVISVHGKGNLAKWRRLYEAFGIPSYIIFDNDPTEDSDRVKRRYALRAIGVADKNQDSLIRATDWLIQDEFAVFGTDFETTLSAQFADYSELEEEARRL